MKKILVMGLPGSGKTTFSESLQIELVKLGKSVRRFNADRVRAMENDWDFSLDGRLRQANRMNLLAEECKIFDFVISDFVAPTEQIRNIYSADYIIWMDTIKIGRFEDTNKVFAKPDKYNYRFTEFSNDDPLKVALDLSNG